jgi:hypothetical protein
VAEASPELYGRCWPTAAQRLLLTAALALDGAAVDAWRRWHARGYLDRTDEGSFRLLPLVFHNLQARGFDDPAMPVLKGIFRRAWAANHALLHALLPVVSGLEARGIPTLLLKGPALATRYYANVGLRPMRDIDVLVPSGEQAWRVITDLQRAGWTLKTWMPPRVGPAFWRFRHSASLFDTQAREVDVHWHVLLRCCRASIDEGFWARAVPLQILGTQTRALDATDQLLLACSYGPELDPIAPLRWIADAVMILRSPYPIDWRRLLDFVLHERLILPTRDALVLLRDCFGAPVPDEVVGRLRREQLSWAERAEAERFLKDDRIQPFPDVFGALYARHRRSCKGQGAVRTAIGFARYLQYYWRVESLWDVVPGALAWIRSRIRGAPTPATS